MTTIPEDKRAEAWIAAVESTDNDQPTGPEVEAAIATVIPIEVQRPKSKPVDAARSEYLEGTRRMRSLDMLKRTTLQCARD